MSRSSCTMAVLIAEVFVIAPCVFQCTSLIRVSNLRVPIGVVDCPEVEHEFPDKGRYWEQLHHVHPYLKDNFGGLEKGRFSKQPSLLCLKSVDVPDKGCYY